MPTPAVAVPSVKAKSTVEDSVVVPVLVTVKVAVPAASLTVTSLMAKLGRSSSVPPAPVPSSLMVPTPWLSLMVALVAPERLTLKVSGPS